MIEMQPACLFEHFQFTFSRFHLILLYSYARCWVRDYSMCMSMPLLIISANLQIFFFSPRITSRYLSCVIHERFDVSYFDNCWFEIVLSLAFTVRNIPLELAL